MPMLMAKNCRKVEDYWNHSKVFFAHVSKTTKNQEQEEEVLGIKKN